MPQTFFFQYSSLQKGLLCLYIMPHPSKGYCAFTVDPSSEGVIVKHIFGGNFIFLLTIILWCRKYFFFQYSSLQKGLLCLYIMPHSSKGYCAFTVDPSSEGVTVKHIFGGIFILMLLAVQIITTKIKHRQQSKVNAFI